MGASADAREALHTEVKKQVDDLSASSSNDRYKAKVLLDLALAFRHIEGGPQPGNSTVTVEK